MIFETGRKPSMGMRMMASAKVKNTRANKLTTIAISRNIKAKLDKNRAPGQCYSGFICQLIDLWEEAEKERISSRAGPAGGNQGAEVAPIHQLN